MKLFTKRGDEGLTDLRHGTRVTKTDLRIEANGQMDELNALMGVARASGGQALVASPSLEQLQRMMMRVMALVAGGAPTVDDVADLQAQTSAMEAAITAGCEKAPFAFVLPGDGLLSAYLHLARAKARTCERRLWAVMEAHELPAEVMVWTNRLSDYLFLLAMQANG